MRLNPVQRKAIVESVQAVFGRDAHVFLFGSRTDDAKKGGDIDLLVDVPRVGEDLLLKKITALTTIKKVLGEQKIDLVVTDGNPETESQLIVRNARKSGLALDEMYHDV